MYTIDIDIDHILDGMKGVDQYLKKVQGAMDDAMMELYVKTDDKLSSQIDAYDLSESKLAKYKYIDIEDDYFEIGLNAPYAEFVEYGTGIKGSQSPHPSPTDWSEFHGYDVHNHGNKGWWYPTDESDPNPNKRIGSDGVLRAWTKGMPARPMVYNTKKYLESQITRTFRKHMLKVDGVYRSKK